LFTSVHLAVVDLPLNPGLQEIVTFSWKTYFALLLLILVTGWLKFNDACWHTISVNNNEKHDKSKYHTGGPVLKFNRKIIERGKINIPMYSRYMTADYPGLNKNFSRDL
jgi:hypothetical protein